VKVSTHSLTDKPTKAMSLMVSNKVKDLIDIATETITQAAGTMTLNKAKVNSIALRLVKSMSGCSVIT
jgi:hypothetical protein